MFKVDTTSSHGPAESITVMSLRQIQGNISTWLILLNIILIISVDVGMYRAFSPPPSKDTSVQPYSFVWLNLS